MRATNSTVPVGDLDVHAYEIPVDGPDGREQDGTLTWSSTTIVLVEAHGGGETGLGYTYGDVSVAALVRSKLASVVTGMDALAPAAAWREMFRQLRNAGQPGAGAMAVSAVDIALWDLKARLLGLPLSRALPGFRGEVPVYGSGGFTNYPLQRLTSQVSSWVAEGLGRVKVKTSRDPAADPDRLAAVRKEAGDSVELFTDANGALSRKSALYWAHRFHDVWGVRWFEEPVSSLDTDGLRLVRDRGPALTSRPGSTGSCCRISPRGPGRWTACRPTSPGAAASPGCCRWAGWPRPGRSTCPGTARRRSARTRSAACRGCGTWSTSTPTSGWRGWRSTACCRRRAARCGRIRRGQGSAWR